MNIKKTLTWFNIVTSKVNYCVLFCIINHIAVTSGFPLLYKV